MTRGKIFRHREWVYTGNSSKGHNIVHVDGQGELMNYIGARDDAMGSERYVLFGELAEAMYFDGRDATIERNGYRIGLVRGVRRDENGFGYQWEADYRVEKVS